MKEPVKEAKIEELQIVPEVTEHKEEQLQIIENSQIEDMSEASISNHGDDEEEDNAILITKESIGDISTLQQKLTDAQQMTNNLKDTLQTLAEGIEMARTKKQKRVANQMALNPGMRINPLSPQFRT